LATLELTLKVHFHTCQNFTVIFCFETGVYLPLNPVLQPVISPSIYPGLSGKWNVPADRWNDMGLAIPDKATLVKIFEQGRADAAAWAKEQPGLTTPAAIRRALASTQLRTS
jgi:hypothetical protein